MDQVVWTDLIIVGTLIWLGYMGARLIGRFNLPAVTGFLLVGIAVGPHGLGLLSQDLLHKIAFAEPIALGLIVFLIGESLTRKMLARHHWSFWLTSALNLALPAIFVAIAVSLVAPGSTIVIWLLAVIGISGAPATVMAVISEVQGRGRGCDSLLGNAALDNIAAVVLYAAVTPFLLLSVRIHQSMGDALMQTGKQIGGALVLGIVAGFLLAKLLERVFKEGEMLALGLTNVLLVVAAGEALGVSSLLAALVAGITVATLEESRNTRERIFLSLRTIEYPVYIIFFTLAGAHLEIGAVTAAGLVAVAYIVARSLGKFLAGFVGSLAARYPLRQSAWFGLGMLPQAGVAVGLALDAANVFPDAGPTVNAVVLASMVLFEVVGPVLTKRAVACLMEHEETEQAEEGALVCPERLILVPVSRALTPDRLAQTLDVAVPEVGDCPPTIVLSHVITPGRAYTVAAELANAERLLERLADSVTKRGLTVDTRLVRARSLERGIARLVEEVGAHMVVLGAPLAKTALGGVSPLRTKQHRVLDALDVPVLIVPHEDSGAVAVPTPQPTRSAERPDGAGLADEE
ncbi:MAG: cation:proton antiporter [Anaerosomatales bacterium]|nr:cation:proton antiporter [Anaerosomatales bacterium]